MFYLEGGNFMTFVNMFMTDSLETTSMKGKKTIVSVKENTGLQYNLIASGMTFYLYNELATMTIKKTGAVTASVANTAKRVIVMVVVAVVFGEELTFEKKVGSALAITGVFVYSIIDDLLKPKAKDASKKA